MINKMISQVAEFHNAFGVKRGNVDTQLRYDLFKEEFEEYKDATNLVERADAIVDMLYIACGTLDLHQEETILAFDKLDFNNLQSEEESLNDIEFLMGSYLRHSDTYDIDNVINFVLELAKINNILDILPELFDEIHYSNLSKLDKNGKPIINDGILDPRKPIGKILKSDLFFEPKLKEILERYERIG